MKDILLSVLFILVVLLITQLFIDSKGRSLNRTARSTIIYLSSLISIIFCITFSLDIGEQFRHDLRAIPYIFGGLFGGPVVSAGLFASIFGYRLLYGIDGGFWGNVLNYGLLLPILMLFSRRFVQKTILQRFLMVIFLIVVHLAFSRIIYSYIFISGMPLSLFIEVSLIKILFVLFIFGCAEGILWYREIRLEIDNMEKMQLVSQLSASMSHEIRNGLTAVYGFLQLLQKKEDDPQKLKYIEISLVELGRTENIISDFLTFSKPAPKQTKTIEMDQLIANSLSLLEPLAVMHSVEVRMRLTPFSFTGDERLLQQSFINIFKNAIEAMPSGGVLDIQTSTTTRHHVITITDTGIGMTEEQLNRMGVPYYTTKGQKGTGLGMMVTFRVIEQLRGKIKVCSEVGKGTVFSIYLPIQQEETANTVL